MEMVRWGVLGVANIATRQVIPAIQATETCRVTAIASRDLVRARAAAEQLGIDRAYGSYGELLEDPDIEAVYIPLPNHLHAEWTLAAAAAGKHVLCEKPLALTADEARRMVEGCARAGVKLMEAFMYRHHPQWVEVKRMVDDGVIGDVYAIQTIFSYRNLDPANIRNIAGAGGGALYDIGCYPVNVARFIYDAEPTDVKAFIRRDPTFGTDALTSAILDFDGRHAVFTVSTQIEDDQRVAIEGTAGRLVVEIPFNIPHDRPTRIYHYAGGNPPAEPHVEVHEIPPANQYGIEAELFGRAIREDTPAPVEPTDAIANMEVLDRIFAAAS
ncbi:MAG TPA: Gfo/Idh/MocA family oxidoreductase [Acidimicrobiia bacterium]|jgi:predicted dehydrogenase